MYFSWLMTIDTPPGLRGEENGVPARVDSRPFMSSSIIVLGDV